MRAKSESIFKFPLNFDIRLNTTQTEFSITLFGEISIHLGVKLNSLNNINYF